MIEMRALAVKTFAAVFFLKGSLRQRDVGLSGNSAFLERVHERSLAFRVYQSALGFIIETAMVTIKEATQNAMRFARDALAPSRAADMRLEEVDSSTLGGQEYWFITLSMVNSNASRQLDEIAVALDQSNSNLASKIFNVLKETGAVTSMKIREFAAA